MGRACQEGELRHGLCLTCRTLFLAYQCMRAMGSWRMQETSTGVLSLPAQRVVAELAAAMARLPVATVAALMPVLADYARLLACVPSRCR